MQDSKKNQISSELWKELRERLSSSQANFESGFKESPEERQRILRQRAKALAAEPIKKEKEDAFLAVVEFGLAHEIYALELVHVREVYPLRELRPLPCTPSFVLGIINIRSQIISIVDIKKFFELPDKGISNLNRVIILHSDKMEFGILADEIFGVRAIPVESIQSSLPTLTGIGAEYLKGITEDRVIILDGEKILLDPKIVVHEEIES